MAREFSTGAKVLLFSSREVVALATIHCVDPNAVVHFKRIGLDRLAVIVNNVLSPDIELCHKAGDMETLGDAKGTFILWDKEDIFPIDVIKDVNALSLTFNIGNVLEMMSLDKEIICEGELLAFEQVNEYSFAIMAITKVSHEGKIDNATSIGAPYYKEGRIMRWCTSFLRKVGKHVIFNEADNLYYMTPQHHDEVIINSPTCLRRACHEVASSPIDSDRLSEVDIYNNDCYGCANNTDVDALSGVEPYNSGCALDVDNAYSDALSGVEYFNDGIIATGMASVCSSTNSISTNKESGQQLMQENTTKASHAHFHQGVKRKNHDSDGLSGVEWFSESHMAKRPTFRCIEKDKTRTFGSIMSTMATRNPTLQMSKDFSPFEFHEDNENQSPIGKKNDIGSYMDVGISNTKHRKYRFLNRKRVQCNKPPQKRDRMLDDANIQTTLMKRCCAKRCMLSIDYDDVKSIRTNVWKRRGSERNEYVLATFSCYLKHSKKTRSVLKFCPLISGKRVCNAAYRAIIGLSHGTYWALIGKARGGDCGCIHGNSGQHKSRKNTLQAEALLRLFLEDNALPQPHLYHSLPNGESVTEKHLPIGLKKKEIFSYVYDKLKEQGYGLVCMNTLYRLWRDYFSDVKIPKRQKMSKCIECDEMKRAMEKASDPEQREKYRKRRAHHLELVQHSRRKYTFWREQAIAHPDRYMCLIVDGMDQNTTTLPRLLATPPRLQGKRFLKTHLCGVLVHGITFYADIWIDSLHQHDSNQVITSITKAIDDVQKEKGKLPPVLRIQADNCWRENKNIYMLAFCSMLVAKHIFTEVELGFLLVGHTHEDIDQVFSTVSREMKKRDLETIDDLIKRAGRKIGGRKESTKSCLLERMFDWKSFIQPFLQKGQHALKGHTNPHYFCFFLKENKPVLQWQYYSIDTKWEPEEPYCIFSTLPQEDASPTWAPIKDFTDKEEAEIEGLQYFIEYKEEMARKYPAWQIENTLVANKTSTLIQYIQNMKLKSNQGERPTSFWPNVNVELHQSTYGIEVHANNEFLANLPRTYCGEARGEFIPETDIHLNDFVAVRSSDDDEAQGVYFWVAKVVDICSSANGKATSFNALWYEPKGRRDGMTNATLYVDCLKRDWIPNSEGVQEQSVQTIIVAWKARTKKTKKHLKQYIVEEKIRIPENCVNHIKAFVRRVDPNHNDVNDESA